MGYRLEGRLLEVCDCNVLCPCWIGEDPDNGTCQAALAYQIDSGNVNGTDVTGLAVGLIADIPGNILQGNINGVLFVDEGASQEQEQGLVDVFTGKLGGSIADVANLYREIRVERAPITFTVEGGKGTLRIGKVVDAEMAPYLGPTGETTTLNESVFTTIPGSPAYVAKASHYHRDGTPYGFPDVHLEGHNAIQGLFLLEA
jgi:hypothetical protein